MNSNLDVKGHLEGLAAKKPLEDYCTNCGECCKPSVHVLTHKNDIAMVRVNKLACKYMSWGVTGSKCSVYKHRHEVAPWCASIFEMISMGLAPSNCPYVKDLNSYVATTTLDNDSYEKYLPVLRLSILNGDLSPFTATAIASLLSE